ncbi:MAG TPA: flagellar motor switch protein FliN [Devosia sp.]|nr:flagellar motor switch protein FliN [Devosia sp.]
MSEDEPNGPDAELPEFNLPDDVSLEDIPLEEMEAPQKGAPAPVSEKTAAELEAVFDIPVRVSVILGRAKIPVADLLNMDSGTVVELDRQVGEAIEVYVNDRLIARGEIVLVENKLGVTMTEIIKAA